jgi:hypothetical protein
MRFIVIFSVCLVEDWQGPTKIRSGWRFSAALS